jgi:low-affinity ferrous iron transport protein
MKWTLTGQLLCNVPPSLIESFFMIILITGHNSADDRKRVDLRNLYERRLHLLAFVNGVQTLREENGSQRA